ncbi:MAG: hypothetical protein DHS20C16_14190 [Phycisphaerae bacterium]|nr:MAG: hypothetical protein DHS20C16_14190 [Phycisphaerae bacterium]
MSNVQQQVARARSRLWMNVWFSTTAHVATWGAVAFGVFVLAARLSGWQMPWLLITAIALGAVLIVGTIWSLVSAPTEAQAATALDEAAGFSERVSSSLYLTDSTDPFDMAVCVDAAAAASSVTVRKHLQLRWPNSATSAIAASLVALAMFLVPDDLFQSDKGKSRVQNSVQVERTKVEVKKRLENIKKMAKGNPAMSDMKEEIEKLEAMSESKMTKPQDLRHEGIKKIDHLADAVRKKQQDEKYDKVKETKRMLRALKEPTGERTPVQKLTRELAAGDFKTAKQTLKKMQEQLATLKQENDKEFTEKMQKQLADLAKQLDNIAKQKQLQKKLEQAGIKKEDVERMLQKLTKEDLEQMKKQLEKSGMSQKQIDKLAQQVKKQQGAKQAINQMSDQMQKAAKAAGSGQMDSASSEMQAAGEQLSEMESLEQEMSQLESTLSDLESAKNDMGDSCKQCSGTGQKNGNNCSGCNGSGMGQGKGGGSGGGQGNIGQGRGGYAQKEQTNIGFKIERGKVETTKGRIIGQFLVDGEQVKGEATEDFVELMAAAERDAIDTVDNDRIPRQYQKAVREYFKRLPKGFGTMPPASDDQDGADGDDASGDEGEPQPAESDGDDAAKTEE